MPVPTLRCRQRRWPRLRRPATVTQSRPDDPDCGFTLIELLVVILIIGILAAIAVPVFLGQRQRGVDAQMKADLKSVARAVEQNLAQTQTYPASITVTASQATVGTETAPLTPGNTVTYDRNAHRDAFCVVITRAAGAPAGTQDGWVWVSTWGGQQPPGTDSCPPPGRY